MSPNIAQFLCDVCALHAGYRGKTTTYCYLVVYRAPATGTRSRGIAHRQSLWLAGMARHWAAGDGGLATQLATQNGVEV